MKKILLGCAIVALVSTCLIGGCTVYYWNEISSAVSGAGKMVSEILAVANAVQKKHGLSGVNVNLHTNEQSQRELHVKVENYRLREGASAQDVARDIAVTALENSQEAWNLEQIRIEFKYVQKMGPASASFGDDYTFDVDELTAEESDSELTAEETGVEAAEKP